MSQIVPFAQRDHHPPEAGRIRIGVKTARAMKAIDTFRFTSPHRAIIEQIAVLYGGTPEPWDDERASMRNQWQVITTTDTIDVMLPQGGLTQHYEMWTGGGAQRRCDGITAEVPGRGPDAEMDSVPCVCQAKQIAECRPHTRINAVLPGVSFMGQWRYETKSEHAVHELTGMYEMIANLTAAGAMVNAKMVLQKRTKMVRGKKQHFNVVVLGMETTPDQLLAGAGHVQPTLSGGTSAPALGAGTTETAVGEPRRSSVPAPVTMDIDADIIDAEIMEDNGGVEVVDEHDDRALEDYARIVADEHDLDADAFVTALWDAAGSSTKVASALDRVRDGEFVPTGIEEGRVKWQKLVAE